MDLNKRKEDKILKHPLHSIFVMGFRPSYYDITKIRLITSKVIISFSDRQDNVNCSFPYCALVRLDFKRKNFK